jgi:transposase
MVSPGEETSEVPTAKYTASCHVWGAIGRDGFAVLVNLTELTNGGSLDADGYIAMLSAKLKGRYLRLCKRYKGHKFVFVQDNAPIHNAQKTKNALRRWKVKTLGDWPPHSPDFNPIENLWSIVKRETGPKLRDYHQPTQANRTIMWKLVHDEWYKAAKEHTTALLESWKHRMNLAIQLNGAYTRY